MQRPITEQADGDDDRTVRELAEQAAEPLRRAQSQVGLKLVEAVEQQNSCAAAQTILQQAAGIRHDDDGQMHGGRFKQGRKWIGFGDGGPIDFGQMQQNGNVVRGAEFGRALLGEIDARQVQQEHGAPRADFAEHRQAWRAAQGRTDINRLKGIGIGRVKSGLGRWRLKLLRHIDCLEAGLPARQCPLLAVRLQRVLIARFNARRELFDQFFDARADSLP